MSINDLCALKSVLEFISVKDLLTASMNYYYTKSDVNNQDAADIIQKALLTFLQ